MEEKGKKSKSLLPLDEILVAVSMRAKSRAKRWNFKIRTRSPFLGLCYEL